MFDQAFYFCANPACVLHIRAGDDRVQGSGNWATLPGGILIGRRRVDGFILCDRCANAVQVGTLVPFT